MSDRLKIASQLAGHIYVQFQNDGTAKEHSCWRDGVVVESLRIADLLIEEVRITQEVRNQKPDIETSTTLPTEPGLYWWRKSEAEEWIAVSAWTFNNQVVYEMVTDHIFLGDALTKAVWESERSIGQWLPCLPPESEVQG